MNKYDRVTLSISGCVTLALLAIAPFVDTGIPLDYLYLGACAALVVVVCMGYFIYWKL